MRHLWKSFGYARHGLIDALKTERSLRLFGLGYGAILIVSFFYHLSLVEWALLLFSGGLFLAVELLNTALEHTVDVIDEHRPKSSDYHKGLKAAKDIAAAAALVALMLVLAVILLIFVPKIL